MQNKQLILAIKKNPWNVRNKIPFKPDQDEVDDGDDDYGDR